MVDQVVEIEGYSKVSVPESYWHVVCSAVVDLPNRSDMLTTESRDAKLGSSVPPLTQLRRPVQIHEKFPPSVCTNSTTSGCIQIVERKKYRHARMGFL